MRWEAVDTCSVATAQVDQQRRRRWRQQQQQQQQDGQGVATPMPPDEARELLMRGDAPPGMHVDGDLDLCRQSALTSLGDGLSVGSDLDLRGCSALAGLGDGLTVGGWLMFADCTALTSLGDGLSVGGNLDLERCSALASLGEGLSVGSELRLGGCSALQERHRGDMAAFFEQLSAVLGPKAGLALAEWDAVEQVPDGFAVGGDLDLQECVNLASLGDSLSVGGDLQLYGCAALTDLGDGLSVGGDLDLEDCAALERLPASILEWPVRDYGDRHNISLGGSGLSQEMLDWLREADAPGLRFIVDLGGTDSAGERGFASAEEAVAFWAEEAGAAQAAGLCLDKDLGDAHAATITRFLSRLRAAKEFGISETRRALARRVVDVLVLVNEDVLVREDSLTRMADSLDACGDKPVWALNQMTLVVEVAKAREDRRKLEALGRRVMRLMVVHEHAKRKVDSLRWVDDVCVYLRFEIDLREALDLPVAATAMIFPSYIAIEDAELEAAKDDALAITDAQFEAWLADWPEWQRQRRREVAEDIVNGGWSSLDAIEPRQSVRKRASRRLSRLLNLSGCKLEDPVTLDSGRSTWSLSDLLRHWERTGLDLHNAPVSMEQLRIDLKRVVAG